MTLPDQRDSEREHRACWTLDPYTHMPLEVTAWRCSPENPDYWYVPQTGWSVPEAALYATEADARAAALDALRAVRDGAVEKIQQLGFSR
jgi:hypothetical protein